MNQQKKLLYFLFQFVSILSAILTRSLSDVIATPFSEWRHYCQYPTEHRTVNVALRRRPNGRCLIALVVVVDRFHITLFSDLDADSVRSCSMWFWMIYCRHPSSPFRTILSVAPSVAVPLRSEGIRLFLLQSLYARTVWFRNSLPVIMTQHVPYIRFRCFAAIAC